MLKNNPVRTGIASVALIFVLLIATVAPLFAAPNLTISANQLIRGRWNSVLFVAQPQTGETLTSFSFSSELPIGELPAGCKATYVPVRNVSCTVKPGVMSVTLEIFVQPNELKRTNRFFFRTWYKDAKGAVLEVNMAKEVSIRTGGR